MNLSKYKLTLSDIKAMIITVLIISIVHLFIGDFEKWITEFEWIASCVGAVIGCYVIKIISRK